MLNRRFSLHGGPPSPLPADDDAPPFFEYKIPTTTVYPRELEERERERNHGAASPSPFSVGSTAALVHPHPSFSSSSSDHSHGQSHGHGNSSASSRPPTSFREASTMSSSTAMSSTSSILTVFSRRSRSARSDATSESSERTAKASTVKMKAKSLKSEPSDNGSADKPQPTVGEKLSSAFNKRPTAPANRRGRTVVPSLGVTSTPSQLRGHSPEPEPGKRVIYSYRTGHASSRRKKAPGSAVSPLAAVPPLPPIPQKGEVEDDDDEAFAELLRAPVRGSGSFDDKAGGFGRIPIGAGVGRGGAMGSASSVPPSARQEHIRSSRGTTTVGVGLTRSPSVPPPAPPPLSSSTATGDSEYVQVAVPAWMVAMLQNQISAPEAASSFGQGMTTGTASRTATASTSATASTASTAASSHILDGFPMPPGFQLPPGFQEGTTTFRVPRGPSMESPLPRAVHPLPPTPQQPQPKAKPQSQQQPQQHLRPLPVPVPVTTTSPLRDHNPDAAQVSRSAARALHRASGASLVRHIMAPAERAEFALRRRSQASFLTDPDGGDEEYELEYAGGKVYDHQVKYAENVFGGLAIAEPESPSSERFRG